MCVIQRCYKRSLETFGKNIKQFKIKALNNNKTVSFAKHSLDGFLCAEYKNKTLTLLENGGNKKHIALESMVYSDFILNKNKFSSHIYSDQIISVGLVLEKNICGNSKYELSKFHFDNIFIF